MYLGKIAELAPANELFERPLHPYTKALLSAVPIPNPRQERMRRITLLTGDPPSPVNPPSGCRFNTRCPLATDRCREEEPQLEQKGDSLVACHYA
jgi:oligopeptide transport system ATP-binding protein